jgi:hypothetical protein
MKALKINIKLTPQKIVLAICGVIALGTLVADAIFYLPLMGRFKSVYFECRTCENQVLEARNIIDSVGNNTSDRTLMTEKEVQFAMDEFVNQGKAKGINFISIRPGDVQEVQGAPYKTMSIDMEVEGPDEKISEFIGSLDELKKAVIKIKSFEITPNPENRTILKARITIDVYITARYYALTSEVAYGNLRG